MQCYTELTPPTAVTHSLSLPFMCADSSNLIVAKSSLLQIFSAKVIPVELADSADTDRKSAKQGLFDKRINDDGGLEASFLGADSVLSRSKRIPQTKLVLVAEYILSGTITSMVSIKTKSSKSGGDALLLGFRDAKLSLVEWDPDRPGISTISIHYYEQDDLQGSPWAPNLAESVNYLTADPGGRCAALKFGARNLAILPFKQDDEDVNMDDWDSDLDGDRPADKESATVTNGVAEKNGTPYDSSFVLRLSSLDPNLTHPIHLSFLHEYREPTFGILSSNRAPASSLLYERKDHLTYIVFTLDLQQRASTTILSVGGLPYDLWKVVPLPAPVGGALLIGFNEIIHIDQAGKANGVGVNVFARQCTSFGLSDQSDLEMRLEGCFMEQISTDNGEMLIILNTGELAILSFRLDGRSVSSLSIRRVSKETGCSAITGKASSISSLGPNSYFIGSEVADSVVLGWSRKTGQQRRNGLLDGDDDDDEEEDEEDEFDEDHNNSKAGDYVFRIHDTLLNIAPIRDLTFGKPAFDSENDDRVKHEGVTSDLELVAATGNDEAGSLVVIHRNIQPKVVSRFEFPEAQGIWTMSAKRPVLKGLRASKEKSAMGGDFGADAQYDRLMIVSKAATDSGEVSDVYAVTAAGFETLTGTEFEPAAGSTLEAGTLGNGMRVIQVLKSEVRSYDGNLGLAQILPMFDDETGADPKIVCASLADPFLLLVRDDASIFVAQCDDDDDLDELEREDDALLSTKWMTGCLYIDSASTFADVKPNGSISNGTRVMMFLLSAGGALYIYALPDLSKAVYVAEGLCFVPPVLSADYAARRSAARETLTEIIVADLGDDVSRSPYLILRPSNDDLTIYEPFRTGLTTDPKSLSSTLHFLKIHNPHLALDPDVSAEETASKMEETRDNPMRAISNLGGYSTVFLPGGSPSFVLKGSKSTPKVISLQGAGVRGMSSFHTEGCSRGFIYADVEGVARVSQLPADSNFTDLGVSAKKIKMDEAVHAVAYHPPLETYVIGTSTDTEFELPREVERRQEWSKEDISFKPTVEQSFIKLINPIGWSIIDSIELDRCEIIMCIKTLNLEISETTHEHKQLIAIGTAISKGEDLPIKGRIYVYDVVIVVPEPDRPETNKKLKLIAKEEIPRGAVTGISEVGTQGFMLVAQGQKCMVRGLKDDGTLLPVAFMDMNCYVTAVKELRGTGLCVFGDALKGVWFAGYTEEPYKMMLFGKSAMNMEVLAADILPDGRDLYVVAADADGDLHILQFDPEHPKSLQGHLLLPRTTFSLGAHLPTTMALLPLTRPSTMLPPTTESFNAALDATIPSHALLMTSTTGVISLLSPLSEIQYRRLSTLTNHLTNTLYHAGGLNPRAYRLGSTRDGAEGLGGGRTIVDGAILGRWMELGSQRRAEIAGRVGVDAEEVREDVKAVGWGGGLNYL